MSQQKPISNATEAMRIAKQAVSDAGYIFHLVVSAKREADKWQVRVETVRRKLLVLINADTGEVIELSSTE